MDLSDLTVQYNVVMSHVTGTQNTHVGFQGFYTWIWQFSQESQNYFMICAPNLIRSCKLAVVQDFCIVAEIFK